MHYNYNIFQKIEKPDVLYEEVVEVKERLVLVQEKCEVNFPHHGVVTGKSDLKVKKVFCFTSCARLKTFIAKHEKRRCQAW